MKKIIFIFFLIFIGCKSYQKISNSEKENIISELDYIGNIDQKYAGVPTEQLIEKYGSDKAWKLFKIKRDSVDLENQNRIKKLYNKYGYLGFDKVGKENTTKFWLPIQHADNDVGFQKKMLKELRKEIKKNNARKDSYALLEDRIAINSNKKQRFGTQVTYSNDGRAIPKNGLIDSLNIEKFRTEYGLPPFKDYYNDMSKMYFDLNKDVLSKKGISEPKLYK